MSIIDNTKHNIITDIIGPITLPVNESLAKFLDRINDLVNKKSDDVYIYYYGNSDSLMLARHREETNEEVAERLNQEMVNLKMRIANHKHWANKAEDMVDHHNKAAMQLEQDLAGRLVNEATNRTLSHGHT